MANNQGLFDRAKSIYNTFIGYGRGQPPLEIPRETVRPRPVSRGEPVLELPRETVRPRPVSRGEPVRDMPNERPVFETFGDKELPRAAAVPITREAPQLETFGDKERKRAAVDNQKVRIFDFAPNLDKVLEITVGGRGEYKIVPGDDDQVEIVIDGTDDQVKEYDIIQNGARVIIEQKVSSTTFSSGGNVVSFSGPMSFSSGYGNNVQIGGIFSGGNIIAGNVGGGRFINSWVNGVYYDHNGNPQYGPGQGPGKQPVQPAKPVKFTINVPSRMVYEIKLTGETRLTADALYRELVLSMSGATSAELIGGGETRIKSSGQCQCTIDDVNGRFNCSSSGSCNTNVAGDFTSVDVNVSGASVVSTEGDCQGDYYASASGAAVINHRGTVHGRVRRSASGVARINV